MITSAKNTPWTGDIAIKNLEGTGLSVDSVVRTSKIATVEMTVLKRVGVLEKSMCSLISKQIHKHLILRP